MAQFRNIALILHQDPVNGGRLAAAWGTRETFIAVVTTNLPMIFPLIKTWLTPFLPRSMRSSSNNKAYKTPEKGFVSIGGGGGSSSNRNGSQKPRHATSSLTFDNESEEHIFKGNGDVELQPLPGAGGTQRSPHSIVVSKQVSVTTEERNGKQSAESFHRH